MFETAELSRKITKKDVKKTAPVLRQELLELQDELRKLTEKGWRNRDTWDAHM